MNTNNVVSNVQAADLAGKEHYLVKLGSTGIDIAGSTDRAIGTLQRAGVKQEAGGTTYIGKACDIYLCFGGHVGYATLGVGTAAIAKGAGLIMDSATPGCMIPSESSPIAIAWQALTAAPGVKIEVLWLNR